MLASSPRFEALWHHTRCPPTSLLWIQDLAKHTSTRIPIPGAVLDCIWSNDGERITYSFFGDDAPAIWERRGDGAGESVKLYSISGARSYAGPKNWSPDGKLLAFVQFDMADRRTTMRLLEQGASSSESTARTYLVSNSSVDWLSFSPDGRWVNFLSDESGRDELYVQRFSGPGAWAEDAKAGRVQVSTSGARLPVWWSRDGKEIRYVDADAQVVSVAVETTPSFSAALPKPLYSIKGLKTQGRTFTPEGRLMVVLDNEGGAITKIDLVVNFLDEMRARLAAGQ